MKLQSCSTDPLKGASHGTAVLPQEVLVLLSGTHMGLQTFPWDPQQVLMLPQRTLKTF